VKERIWRHAVAGVAEEKIRAAKFVAARDEMPT